MDRTPQIEYTPELHNMREDVDTPDTRAYERLLRRLLVLPLAPAVVLLTTITVHAQCVHF